MKKIKNKQKHSMRHISYANAEKNLMEALKAEPSDIKVPISVRLDGDIYLELKRLAEDGQCNGKYQTLINEILRRHLFSSTMASWKKPHR